MTAAGDDAPTGPASMAASSAEGRRLQQPRLDGHAPTVCRCRRSCTEPAFGDRLAVPSTTYARGVRRRVRSTRSCAITSRPFGSVAGLPAGSRGFAAATAAWTGWSLFPVKAARLVRVGGGRRMAERAAHLLDHVFADVMTTES